MTLADWMAEHGISDEALAEKLGINRTTISRVRRGKMLPSSALMADITRATDGAVAPNSFFPELFNTDAAA